MVTRPSWDLYFLNIAEAVATRSSCSRASVGAVIVQDHIIVSTGYNGAPAGEDHCEHECLDLACREHSCPVSIHAEANAIVYASRYDTVGATIYTTLKPCPTCSLLIKAAGITNTVYLREGM